MNISEEAIERAQQRYAEMKQRRAALEGKDKKFFETIEAVDTGRYGLYTYEIELVESVYGNSSLYCSLMFFKYGFLKGQRAEKAKKKKRQSVKA